MSRQRGLGVLFGVVAFALLALAAFFSPSSGVSLGPVDGWISGIDGIEDNLREATEDRLTAMAIRDASVTVDGRDVTVALPSGFPADMEPSELSTNLLHTKGVRSISFDAAVPKVDPPAIAAPEPTPAPTAAAEPTPEPTTAPAPEAEQVTADNDIVARVDLGSVLVSGDVQTTSQQSALLAELGAVADLRVVDQTQVIDAAATDETDAQVVAAASVVGLLAQDFASGSVRLSGDQLFVEALAGDEQTADGLTRDIAGRAAASGLRAVVNISVPTSQPEAVVESLDLSGVNFESGTAQLRSDAFAILDDAAAALRDVAGVNIEVQGHTDDQGGADGNQALSEARAQAVADYLSANGVDPDVLTVRGYGEAEPIDDNQTEQGRAANRRVELVVIEGN